MTMNCHQISQGVRRTAIMNDVLMWKGRLEVEYLRSRLGLLLPEKYESIFDVSSKGPSSGSLVNKDGGRENTRFYIMNKSRDKIKTNEMDFNQNKV